MQYSQQSASEGIVLMLEGAFTFKDHHSFRAVLDLLKASKGERRVLDLSKLDFIDSAALGMLMVAHDEAETAGWVLTLRSLSTPIARLMQLASLDTLFKIEL